VHKLLDRVFTLAGLQVAVEVFACYYLRGKLTPGGGYFDIVLLEDSLAGIAGDFGGALFPDELINGMSTGR
jgi:hypothetical protein